MKHHLTSYQQTPCPWGTLSPRPDGDYFTQGLVADDAFSHLPVSPAIACGRTIEQCKANADRIVACVNVLDGIPTEVLLGEEFKDFIRKAFKTEKG